MARIRITNWRRWQSYRSDRGQPPWIKVHRCTLRNPEWVSLEDYERGQLISIWMLAADYDGAIVTPDHVDTLEKIAEHIKQVCCMSKSPHLQTFINLGFIEKWRQSDAKPTPSRRQHDAPESESETETEADISHAPGREDTTHETLRHRKNLIEQHFPHYVNCIESPERISAKRPRENLMAERMRTLSDLRPAEHADLHGASLALQRYASCTWREVRFWKRTARIPEIIGGPPELRLNK